MGWRWMNNPSFSLPYRLTAARAVFTSVNLAARLCQPGSLPLHQACPGRIRQLADLHAPQMQQPPQQLLLSVRHGHHTAFSFLQWPFQCFTTLPTINSAASSRCCSAAARAHPLRSRRSDGFRLSLPGPLLRLAQQLLAVLCRSGPHLLQERKTLPLCTGHDLPRLCLSGCLALPVPRLCLCDLFDRSKDILTFTFSHADLQTIIPSISLKLLETSSCWSDLPTKTDSSSYDLV